MVSYWPEVSRQEVIYIFRYSLLTNMGFNMESSN